MAKPADVRLLLVEDMEDMRNILKRLLYAMGFAKITTARNGEEAWSALRSDPPDLVLCDWNMPKMTGRQLLDAVRADPKLSLIPFVMITGENTTAQVKSAVSGGVTDFIVKPFTAAALEHRLLQVLEKAPLLSNQSPQP